MGGSVERLYKDKQIESKTNDNKAMQEGMVGAEDKCVVKRE